MTNEEAIKRLKESRTTIQPFEYVNEAIDYAIKALEQQPCDDCISREAVLEIIEKEEFKGDAIYGIERLPSVTPKYTDEEIDKAQAVEQAYVDKMVELAVE